MEVKWGKGGLACGEKQGVEEDLDEFLGLELFMIGVAGGLPSRVLALQVKQTGIS